MNNGYTKISNEYLEKLVCSNLTGAQYQIVLTVMRQTWGWNKKRDKLSYGQIAKKTTLHRQSVIRAIKKLVAKRLLVVSNTLPVNTLELQKDYKKWVVAKRLLVTNRLPPSSQAVTRTSSQAVTHKRKKETYTKEIYTLFDYWNEKGIIKHKTLNGKQSVIKESLKDYSLLEIKKAIDNYSIVISSNDYWFNYRWTLSEFIKRGLEKFLDINNPIDNFKKEGNARVGSVGERRPRRYRKRS